MRLIGVFFFACVVLAAAQALAVALAILFAIAFIASLFAAPKETLGFVCLFLALGAFQTYPLAFLGVVALIVIAGIIQKRRRS